LNSGEDVADVDELLGGGYGEGGHGGLLSQGGEVESGGVVEEFGYGAGAVAGGAGDGVFDGDRAVLDSMGEVESGMEELFEVGVVGE
jgi:hypothetical protein